MSIYVFRASVDGESFDVRAGWHTAGNHASYFGEVWRDGDDLFGEILSVGLAGVDEIRSFAELRERMGEWARFLPADLFVAQDQKTELSFVRIMGDGSSISHYAVKRGQV